MKIAALCPTYNRYPKLRHLLEESVECFLQQTYTNSELIILNDTLNQNLVCEHSRVRVLNVAERFATLSDKIQYMVDNSDADLFCRWDDDDISLPWRFQLSLKNLGKKLEWRPDNYWYSERNIIKAETQKPGNTHIMGIWHRDALSLPQFNGVYPPKLSGGEDQLFNKLIGTNGEVLPKCKMFYIYRWGTGSHHLSGAIDSDKISCHVNWDAIGKSPIQAGTFLVEPKWEKDYVKLAQQAAEFL